jgi:hypothetical protein
MVKQSDTVIYALMNRKFRKTNQYLYQKHIMEIEITHKHQHI